MDELLWVAQLVGEAEQVDQIRQELVEENKEVAGHESRESFTISKATLHVGENQHQLWKVIAACHHWGSVNRRPLRQLVIFMGEHGKHNTSNNWHDRGFGKE